MTSNAAMEDTVSVATTGTVTTPTRLGTDTTPHRLGTATRLPTPDMAMLLPNAGQSMFQSVQRFPFKFLTKFQFPNVVKFLRRSVLTL